jgi:S-adenosylmethionine hydrolase
MRPLITLTTDFGTGSPYVAQTKGVILTICRDVDVVDISHAIQPQNIREAAIVLADVTPRFPPGTIHVAVVDPGVGTSRRLIYAEIGAQRYLAPDNGLLSLVLNAAGGPAKLLLTLENPQFWLREPSRTFHGRDILAPVAAHLAGGLDPSLLGPKTDSLESLEWNSPEGRGDQVAGEVLYVDSFGNLITNLRHEDVMPCGEPATVIVECGGALVCGIAPTYGAASPGQCIALYDSQGRLEIAVVRGSAADTYRLAAGARVVVRPTK